MRNTFLQKYSWKMLRIVGTFQTQPLANRHLERFLCSHSSRFTEPFTRNVCTCLNAFHMAIPTV